MILSLPLYFFLTWQMQELTELFAPPPRPEKCPSLPFSSLSSSRTAATPPCLLVCGLFSAQSYHPFGAHWWSTAFTFLFDRHILFLWIPLTYICFLDIFHFVAFLFLTIRVAFILHSNRFLISSFFVFYCFTFAFFVVIFIFFNFVFSSLTADPLRIQSTKGPAPKFPFLKNAL